MTRIETLEKVFGLARVAPPESREIREGLGVFLLRPYGGNISRAALRSTADVAALPPGNGLRRSVHAGWTFPPAIQDIERWNGL